MQKTISKETNKKNMWTQNPDKSFTPGRVGQLGVIDDREKEYREAHGLGPICFKGLHQRCFLHSSRVPMPVYKFIRYLWWLTPLPNGDIDFTGEHARYRNAYRFTKEAWTWIVSRAYERNLMIHLGDANNVHQLPGMDDYNYRQFFEWDRYRPSLGLYIPYSEGLWGKEMPLSFDMDILHSSDISYREFDERYGVGAMKTLHDRYKRRMYMATTVKAELAEVVYMRMEERRRQEYREKTTAAAAKTVAVKSWAAATSGESQLSATAAATQPVYSLESIIVFSDNSERMRGKVVSITRTSAGQIVYDLLVSKEWRTFKPFKKVRYTESLLQKLEIKHDPDLSWVPRVFTEREKYTMDFYKKKSW